LTTTKPLPLCPTWCTSNHSTEKDLGVQARDHCSDFFASIEGDDCTFKVGLRRYDLEDGAQGHVTGNVHMNSAVFLASPMNVPAHQVRPVAVAFIDAADRIDGAG
jgi:hypothetical protein